MDIRITHVRLWDRPATHQRITHLKWVDIDEGTTDFSTKARIVEWINAGGTAYVGTASTRAKVKVVHPVGATPYLRAYAEEGWTNDLLDLPAF